MHENASKYLQRIQLWGCDMIFRFNNYGSMRNSLRFYKICRLISAAVMAVVIGTVVVATLMQDKSLEEGNSHLTETCYHEGVHFCIVIHTDSVSSLSGVIRGTQTVGRFI